MRGGLQEALSTERSLPDLRAQIDSLRASHEQATARVASIEAERESLPQAIEQAGAALSLMRADADTLPEAASTLRALHERLDASLQADLLRSALLGASDDLRDATVAAKLANAASADGHDLWIAQSASALAAELEEDSPCPVCGSTEHPNPAPAADGQITREQVAQLDQERDRAESALRDAQVRHQDLVRRIAQLNEVAGAPTPMLESQRDEAAARVDKLEALGPQIAQVEAALSQERARLDGLTDTLAAARESAASLASTLRVLSLWTLGRRTLIGARSAWPHSPAPAQTGRTRVMPTRRLVAPSPMPSTRRAWRPTRGARLCVPSPRWRPWRIASPRTIRSCSQCARLSRPNA